MGDVMLPESARTRNDPFRCTVPDRRHSALKSLIGFAAAAAFLAGLLLTQPIGWLSYLLYGSCFLLCAAFGLLFLLAAVMPGMFLMGLALAEDGFEFRAPLRAPKFISFREIRRIEAVNRDGDWGYEVPWRIYTQAGKVLVTEQALYKSGLHEILKSRLSIDQNVLSAAHKHKPRGLFDFLFGKSFIIYESKQA